MQSHRHTLLRSELPGAMDEPATQSSVLSPQSSPRSSPRATKIVCTIGPASAAEALLDGLIAPGMNVARVNRALPGPEEATATVERVRRLAAPRNPVVAGLVDLQGPKIRTGPLAGGGPVPL